MTQHALQLVVMVEQHSEPSLLPYVLGFALCVLGLAWTVLELLRRLR